MVQALTERQTVEVPGFSNRSLANGATGANIVDEMCRIVLDGLKYHLTGLWFAVLLIFQWVTS